MTIQFIYHILITTCIFYIITTWFKFFLKLRMNIDFSYMAIVLFGSYTSVLLNMHLWVGMLAAMVLAWIISLPFTLLIVYLSKRLQAIYFVVGVLALYMFVFQVALNREWVTWWAFGLSGMQRILRWTTILSWLQSFFILSWLITLILIIILSYFKRTYIFSLLTSRWENATTLRVLGVPIHMYSFIMVLITSLCAVIWWNLYAFYYLFIDPRSFWLSMLVLILVIAFLSYNQNESMTFLITLVIIVIYELLRFLKFVDPASIGYVREWLFALIIMIAAFITFKKTAFERFY